MKFIVSSRWTEITDALERQDWVTMNGTIARDQDRQYLG